MCWRVELVYIKDAKDFAPTKTCVFVRDDNPVTAGRMAAIYVERWLGKADPKAPFPKALQSQDAEFLGLPKMYSNAMSLDEFLKLYVSLTKYEPLTIWSGDKPPQVVCFWGQRKKGESVESIGNIG